MPGLDALVMTRALLQSSRRRQWRRFRQCRRKLVVRSAGRRGPARRCGEWNLAELCRELAGVRALAPPPDTEVAGYSGDKPVTYRPFLRGDEGIVALWNNSGQRKSVAVEVRCRPWQVRLLRISYPGETCQREFDGSFEWDELAKRFRQPAVYVDLEPLQTVVLSLKLRGAHAQWLREIGEKPIAPPPVNKMGHEGVRQGVWAK